MTSSNLYPILQSISQIKYLESLTLDLESTPIDDSTAVDLFQMFRNKKLVNLNLKLTETGLTKKGFEIMFLLLATLQSKSLKTLRYNLYEDCLG